MSHFLGGRAFFWRATYYSKGQQCKRSMSRNSQVCWNIAFDYSPQFSTSPESKLTALCWNLGTLNINLRMLWFGERLQSMLLRKLELVRALSFQFYFSRPVNMNCFSSYYAESWILYSRSRVGGWGRDSAVPQRIHWLNSEENSSWIWICELNWKDKSRYIEFRRWIK